MSFFFFFYVYVCVLGCPCKSVLVVLKMSYYHVNSFFFLLFVCLFNRCFLEGRCNLHHAPGSCDCCSPPAGLPVLLFPIYKKHTFMVTGCEMKTLLLLMRELGEVHVLLFSCLSLVFLLCNRPFFFFFFPPSHSFVQPVKCGPVIPRSALLYYKFFFFSNQSC